MSGIGIILNRNAGRCRHLGLRELMRRTSLDPDSLRETSTVDEIADVARVFLAREIDILGIIGGDGSTHRILTEFLRVYGEHPLPRVALLCGGSHNAHAASIGIRGRPEKLLDCLIRQYRSGGHFCTTRRSMLRVEDGEETRHGFILATGFKYRFIRELNARGLNSSLKIVLLFLSWFFSYSSRRKNLMEMFRLEPGTITISGEMLPWELNNCVSASGVEQAGLGFVAHPRANETPHTFQADAFRVRPGTFARLLWACRRGRLPEHNDYYCTITDHLVYEAPEKVSYVLDGELYNGGTRLDVRTGPRIDLILI